MRALWYFQINLLWEKGTLVLEPQNADYIPRTASEQGNLGSDRKKTLQFAMEEFAGGMGCGRFRQSDKGAAKVLLGKAYATT